VFGEEVFIVEIEVEDGAAAGGSLFPYLFLNFFEQSLGDFLEDAIRYGL
jgi:hypothetical protein